MKLNKRGYVVRRRGVRRWNKGKGRVFLANKWIYRKAGRYNNTIIKLRFGKRKGNKFWMYWRVPVKQRSVGKLYIRRTFNNIFVTLVDHRRKVRYVCSAGVVKLRGKKKRTDFAGEEVGRRIGEKIVEKKIRKLDIVIKTRVRATVWGVIRGLKRKKGRRLVIERCIPKAAIAHNGCRPKKMRRV